jgi:hypothetical protein
MRGSVWCKLKIWLVNKDGSIRKTSGETIYSYGAVTNLNNSNQQSIALQKTINKGLATYREYHDTSSDTEVNYILLDDGIQYTRIEKGETKRIKWTQTTLKPKEKRAIHKEVYLAKEGQLTEKQKQKPKEKHKISKSQYKEKTRAQYRGIKKKRKPLKRKTNK